MKILIILAQYPLSEEFVSLVPVYMCRIRNRTVPFIAQKMAVLRVSPIYSIGSNERVNTIDINIAKHLDGVMI